MAQPAQATEPTVRVGFGAGIRTTIAAETGRLGASKALVADKFNKPFAVIYSFGVT